MKERPILFSGEMVRAILGGRKTQTRRIIKAQPIEQVRYPGWYSWKGQNGWRPQDLAVHGSFEIGQHLYVREIFGYVWPEWCDNGLVEERGIARPITAEECDVVYRATDPDYLWANDEGEECTIWKPSIHMPKRLARIWLKVVNVRAERLQEISGTDILAEGVDTPFVNFNWNRNSTDDVARIANRFPELLRLAFAELWDSVNVNLNYKWDADRWVWAVQFRRLIDESHTTWLLERRRDHGACADRGAEAEGSGTSHYQHQAW